MKAPALSLATWNGMSGSAPSALPAGTQCSCSAAHIQCAPLLDLRNVRKSPCSTYLLHKARRSAKVLRGSRTEVAVVFGSMMEADNERDTVLIEVRTHKHQPTSHKGWRWSLSHLSGYHCHTFGKWGKKRKNCSPA